VKINKNNKLKLNKMEILNKIQRELKAPKGQKNTFGNYNYRSCEDILEAVKPLLGTAILTINDEVVLIGDRYYIKATATIKQGEESFSISAFAREPEGRKGMDEAQVTGATSSYARKYALNGLFAIDDTKDSDATNNGTSEKNVNNVYKAKQEANKIKTLPELRKFYAKNKGLGKEFDSYIVELSKKFKEEPKTETL
jgi:hypothetical protein